MVSGADFIFLEHGANQPEKSTLFLFLRFFGAYMLSENAVNFILSDFHFLWIEKYRLSRAEVTPYKYHVAFTSRRVRGTYCELSAHFCLV